RRERAVRWVRRHPARVALAAVLLAAAASLGVFLQQDAARERHRLAGAREEVLVSLREGQRAFGQRDWSAAQSRAAAVLERLDREPRLQELRPEAEDLHAEAGRRLKAEIADREK